MPKHDRGCRCLECELLRSRLVEAEQLSTRCYGCGAEIVFSPFTDRWVHKGTNEMRCCEKSDKEQLKEALMRLAFTAEDKIRAHGMGVSL